MLALNSAHTSSFQGLNPEAQVAYFHMLGGPLLFLRRANFQRNTGLNPVGHYARGLNGVQGELGFLTLKFCSNASAGVFSLRPI